MDPMETDRPEGGSNKTPRSHGHAPPLRPTHATYSIPPHSPASSVATPGTQATDTTHVRAASYAHSVASPPGPESSSSKAASVHDPQHASKRRRGLGVVTPNACNECRKKRSKCDGNQPCGRCRSLGTDCVYEVRVRQSKENLREEIEQLNRQKQSRDQVLAALARSDRPDLREDVLARLRNGQNPDAISEWLAGAGATPTITARTASPHATGGVNQNHPLFNYMAPSPVEYGLTSGSSPHATSTGYPQSRQHIQPSQSHLGSYTTSHQPPNEPTSFRSTSNVMNWTARSGDFQPVGNWGDNQGDDQGDADRFRGLDQVLSPEIAEMKVPSSAWTKVTDDSRLVQHLLALYFCWEYPTFASLSKEHFLKDFQDGRARYCSSILVNALLALGCRFSSHPATRAIPDDPYSSGDHFFGECVRQLREEEHDHCRMTTIQALGIMSIREASCGRDSESWYYAGQSMRLALEMGLQFTGNDGRDDDEAAVRSATFWGAYSLDLAWCLATGTLPQCSASPKLPPKPSIIDDIEASLWIPYTDNGAPFARSSEQPSNVRSVYKCFCELSELVHKSLYVLHQPGKPVTSQKLQSLYTGYLSWYEQVPDVLRLGHNFTPSVLFAHMYYHFATLLLFRPFIKLRLVDSTTVPREVCMQAADAIQGLSGSYSKLYTLRRTPSFVPYFVLTSSIMHLAIGAESSTVPRGLSEPHPPAHINPHIAQAISRGIADLTEMAPCHHFAEQALNILLHLAKRWHLEIRVKGSDQEEAPHLKDLLAQPAPPVSRPGIRPATDSLNLFIPEVTANDVMCAWGIVPPDVPPPRDTRRPWVETVPPPRPPSPRSHEQDNPLFWPFPVQGRPIIASGFKLRLSGFELL